MRRRFKGVIWPPLLDLLTHLLLLCCVVCAVMRFHILSPSQTSSPSYYYHVWQFEKLVKLDNIVQQTFDICSTPAALTTQHKKRLKIKSTNSQSLLKLDTKVWLNDGFQMDVRPFGTLGSLDICRTGLFVVSKPFFMCWRFEEVIYGPPPRPPHTLVVCKASRTLQHRLANP